MEGLLREFIANTPPNVSRELQYLLCKATLLAFPKAPQKMTELVEAFETGFDVNMCPNGHDLIKDGKTLELKRSQISVSKERRPTCSIMWSILDGKTLMIRKERMKKFVQENSSIGYVRFIIINPDGSTMKTYEFSNSFMIKYFDIAIKHDTKKLNMGSTVCLNCQIVPRLERMKKMENEDDITSLFETKTAPHKCP